MLKLFFKKLPNIYFLIIFAFLFSPTTYATLSSNTIISENSANFVGNSFNYSFDPLSAISNELLNLNQYSRQSTNLNYDQSNKIDNIGSSSCGYKNKITKASKIIISQEGKVLNSTAPNIKKGQNLFDFWKNTKVLNPYGEKLGSLGDLSEKFFKNYNVLFFVNRSTNNFGILKAVWSSVNNQVTANAKTLEQIELDIFIQELDSSDCDTAISCVIDAVFSASGAFAVCGFDGSCPDMCDRIGKNMKDYEANIERVLCQDVGTAIASIVDLDVLISAALIEISGCVSSCAWPIGTDHKLKEICDDVDKVNKIMSKIACDGTAEEKGNIINGIATNIGQDGNDSSTSISGEFSFGEQIDFANSTVRIDKTLFETSGAGELIRENSDVEESFLFPVRLHPEGTNLEIIQTDLDTFVYETPGKFLLLQFQMTIERTEMSENEYNFTLDILNASIPDFPQLCDENTLLTELVTSFVIDDDINTPLNITATEQWDCESVEPNELTIGMEPNTIGSGCSLANKGDKPFSDLFLLLILFPLIIRLRKFWKRK